MTDLAPDRCVYSIADSTALVSRCMRQAGHDGVHTASPSKAEMLDNADRLGVPAADGPPQLTAPPLVDSASAHYLSVGVPRGGVFSVAVKGPLNPYSAIDGRAYLGGDSAEVDMLATLPAVSSQAKLPDDPIEVRALARYREAVIALGAVRRLVRTSEDECRAARMAWCEALGVYDADDDDLAF